MPRRRPATSTNRHPKYSTVEAKGSRKARLRASRYAAPITYMAEPVIKGGSFQTSISILYGVKGIGKTTLLSLIPGMYALPTEPGSDWRPFRQQNCPTWRTLTNYIKDCKEHPERLDGVEVHGIDTIDMLVASGIDTICDEWGLLDLSDEGWSRAWLELRQELIYQLLQLKALGPGLLLVSHTRSRIRTFGNTECEVDSLDLSPSICEAVSNVSDIILHMRYTVDQSRSDRCLCCLGSKDEDAKDNTGKILTVYPDGIINFKTEQEAVSKLLACFEKGGSNSKHTKHTVHRRRRRRPI